MPGSFHRRSGHLNPPLVRQLEDGRLELVAGERRKYSAIMAGLSTIPVFVRDDLSAVHQLAGMLVENHDRESLTPTEEAVAIAQLAGFEGARLPWSSWPRWLPRWRPLRGTPGLAPPHTGPGTSDSSPPVVTDFPKPNRR